jgi:hypothetical protein
MAHPRPRPLDHFAGNLVDLEEIVPVDFPRWHPEALAAPNLRPRHDQAEAVDSA